MNQKNKRWDYLSQTKSFPLSDLGKPKREVVKSLKKLLKQRNKNTVEMVCEIFDTSIENDIRNGKD